MYESLLGEGDNLSFCLNSIILCSLLHNVCKMDEYAIEDGYPKHSSHYHNGNPHGMKSIHLLQRWYLELSDEERQTIIWHMGSMPYTQPVMMQSPQVPNSSELSMRQIAERQKAIYDTKK